MLSAETGVGAHPVETVATMDRIIVAAETNAGYPDVSSAEEGVPDSVADAAVSLAGQVGARALVAYTLSGRAAALLASRRPEIAVVVCTNDEAICRQLAITWGVESIVVDRVRNTDEMFVAIDNALREQARLAPGTAFVIVAATPVGADRATNTVHVHEVTAGDSR